MDSIKADHGYNMDSKSVKNLLQTMSELTPAQRRDFLQFTTGSPKLPIGGMPPLLLPQLVLLDYSANTLIRLQELDPDVYGSVQTQRGALHV